MAYILKENKNNTYLFNKSKFICYVFSVNNIEEVKNHLTIIKNKHCDARHIVYAYRINESEKKFYEDREPTNTCAKPVLFFLEQKDIQKTLVIIVRYFGGILLGVGNLKHAYLEPFFKCIENNLELYVKKYYFEIECPYDYINKINYLAQNKTIKLINTIYHEKYVYYQIETNLDELKPILPFQVKVIKKSSND